MVKEGKLPLDTLGLEAPPRLGIGAHVGAVKGEQHGPVQPGVGRDEGAGRGRGGGQVLGEP